MATKIFRRLEEVQLDSHSVITVGTFDGLHRGHQAIIATLKKEARARKGSATVVTFDPHPQAVLQRPDKPPVQILTTTEEKIALLQRENVERLLVIPFTLEFSRTSSEIFVREILHRRAGLQAMVIGHDHGFGKDREGDFATLQRLGNELGFAVREVPPFEVNGVTLSSTKVREALLNGEVEKAAEYLGRAYTWRGGVERGDQRGRLLGFPTANLRPIEESKLTPANGVFAVWIEIEKPEHDPKKYPAMMNIGMRPTFGKLTRTIEAHLLDFSGDLYGMTLNIHFVARLRSEKKFDSPQALIAQLQRDREASLKIFSH
jgi:riboflavin kinase/FMN adenylyltransferase